MRSKSTGSDVPDFSECTDETAQCHTLLAAYTQSILYISQSVHKKGLLF